MSELNGDTKAQLILAAADVIINKGLPALAKLANELNNRDVVTTEDIEAVKGEVDSAEYFE